MSKITFEVCLQSIDGVHAALAGGAHRVELCAALVEGGITPSSALIEAAVATGAEVMVMIRPRGGDFLYSPAELDVMEKDIHAAKAAGAAGVVLGVLTPSGEVAGPQVQRFREASQGMQLVFHRAFDVSADPYRSLETLIELGVDRVLTSGQAATVPEGIGVIKRLVDQAAGRIAILPGCGITPENVAAVIAATGVTEFHATAFSTVDSSMLFRNPHVYMGIPGLPEYEKNCTDAAVVRAFIRAAQSN